MSSKHFQMCQCFWNLCKYFSPYGYDTYDESDNRNASETRPLISATQNNNTVINKSLRSFVIVYHPTHGFLLMLANKAKKGKHFQLCGGRPELIDLDDFDSAKRELFEETGMDITDKFRFRQLPFKIDGKAFFFLKLSDKDSVAVNGSRSRIALDVDFKVRLSHEHVDFSFVKSPQDAARAVSSHSGGSCSEALIQLASLPNFNELLKS